MAKEGRPSVGSAGDTFPIVAIGASAGGIRALGLFFDAVPPDIRMAFVVVLHLHATTTSHVADVLATHTALPTVEVTKPTRVDAGRIFVIAANRALTIRGGVLYAPPRREPPGLHRPIDVFFQSLAKDQGERAVAVVLSGAGSDASIGIKAVKEHMGTVLAQDPATAEHASMPSSAIATGMVDGILAPGAMPAALLRFVRHPQEPPAYGTEGGTPSGDLHLAMCLSMLRERLGRDYSGYRKAMLCRRIARRQRLRGVERLADYVTMVDAEPDELAALNGDLMTRCTAPARAPVRPRSPSLCPHAGLGAAARPGGDPRPVRHDRPERRPVLGVPKGFFPQQDTGRLIGGIVGDQSISFQAMSQKLQRFLAIIQQDPAVASVVGFTGGRQANSGFVFIGLKPLAERQVSADLVIARLRPRLGEVPGARLFLQAVQDIRVGGRQANAQYQFTLQADSPQELNEWAPKLTAALREASRCSPT